MNKTQAGRWMMHVVDLYKKFILPRAFSIVEETRKATST
jgi:hypothetical protein